MMLTDLTALELFHAYRSHSVSPVEVTESVLERLKHLNPTLNAFCAIDEEGALKAAKISEKRWLEGLPLGQLDGIPISIKDQVMTKGYTHGLGTRVLAKERAEHDAPAVARLRESGAIIFGKTTMPELGVAGVTESLAYGTTRNPWNPELTPGGSSGGASSAVAARIGPLALASDGAGSIRMPCSFTNLAGLKPTYGRVPYYPYPNFKTVVGPIGRTVEDIAMTMNVITKPDSRDWTRLPYADIDYLENINAVPKVGTLALSLSIGDFDADEDVTRIIADAPLDCMATSITPLSLSCPDLYDAWLRTSMPRLSHLLHDLRDEWDDLFAPSITELLRYGENVTIEQIAESQTLILQAADQISQLLAKYEAIAMPSVPYVPFSTGLFYPDGNLIAYEAHRFIAFTCPFNLTQNPAVTVPCGFTTEGLPVGLQIVGRRFADLQVLGLAKRFQDAVPLFRQAPDDDVMIAGGW